MSETCTRRLTFSAGHRVLGHEGKCRFPHGHNYAVEITVEAAELDDVGRVIDFGEVKARVGGWIDEHWDHGFIVYGADLGLIEAFESMGERRMWVLEVNPTAENIANALLSIAGLLLDGTGVRVTRVRVHETENCYADAVPET